MSRIKKLDFEKVLDSQMKDLIGTRNWKKWQAEEPEMHSTILQAMYDYGKKKWNEAQSEAAKRSRERKDKNPSMIGFPISITQFKP